MKTVAEWARHQLEALPRADFWILVNRANDPNDPDITLPPDMLEALNAIAETDGRTPERRFIRTRSKRPDLK